MPEVVVETKGAVRALQVPSHICERHLTLGHVLFERLLQNHDLVERPPHVVLQRVERHAGVARELRLQAEQLRDVLEVAPPLRVERDRVALLTVVVLEQLAQRHADALRDPCIERRLATVLGCGVRDARESQQKGKEEFRTALERFKAVVETDGGTLEQKHDKLNRELERSEDRAKEIRDRVKAVKDVADDLFREWEKELGQYKDRQVRAESEREPRETRRRAQGVIKAMEAAEKRVDPVLQPLRDRVLFLKHNLNAAAIGALDKELLALRTNVDALVADLESSIAESEAFLAEMDAAAKAAS